MDDASGFEAVAERAWAGFRARLADRVATLADDELVHIDAGVGVDPEELEGANPYLQVVGWSDGLLRAEAAGNALLAPGQRLGEEALARMRAIGWHDPTYVAPAEPDDGSANHWLDLERREADLLAVVCVRTLREVYGCPHPAFLDADGLETDPAAAAPEANSAREVEEEPIAVFAESPDELEELVDAALALMFEEPLRHDADGDLPVVIGKSVVLVRIADDVPAVDLVCELAVEIVHLDRAQTEVAILNRDHPSMQFHLRDDTIVARYRLCAVPFSATQLRAVLAAFCEGLDETARDLTRRVGGRRLLEGVEETPVARPGSAPAADRAGEEHPALSVLRELALTGPVSAEMAATVCGMDRELIAEQIIRLRRACDEGAGDEGAGLIATLADALRLVVEREMIRERR